MTHKFLVIWEKIFATIVRMKICGQEFGEETIIRIREMIREGLSRTRLSQEVCRLLDWKNRAGKLKEMSCRLALKVLHEKGEIVLPEARVISIGKKAPPKPRRSVQSLNSP